MVFYLSQLFLEPLCHFTFNSPWFHFSGSVPNWRKMDWCSFLVQTLQRPTPGGFSLAVASDTHSMHGFSQLHWASFLRHPLQLFFCTQYFANLTDFLLGHQVSSLFKAFTQTAFSPHSNSFHSAGRLHSISTEQFVPLQRPSLPLPCFVILPCLFVGCLPTPPDSELPEGEGLLALSSNMLSEPGLAPSTKSS